jgi:hypothetical protein
MDTTNYIRVTVREKVYNILYKVDSLFFILRRNLSGGMCNEWLCEVIAFIIDIMLCGHFVRVYSRYICDN